MIASRTRAVLCSAAALAFGAAFVPTGTANAETMVAQPDSFTSAFTAMATPDMVINPDGVLTPGTAGAWGTFNYRINSDLDVICYDITVEGITAPFQSPAKTATHIHQAPAGKPGPPRIAFPNPIEQPSGAFQSSGCLKGPLTTGVKNVDTGIDTGVGFTVKQIEDDPAAFFTDTHTKANPVGAVRGQLTAVPLGGVETGAGGTAAGSPTELPLLPIGAGLALVLGAGMMLHRKATA